MIHIFQTINAQRNKATAEEKRWWERNYRKREREENTGTHAYTCGYTQLYCISMYAHNFIYIHACVHTCTYTHTHTHTHAHACRCAHAHKINQSKTLNHWHEELLESGLKLAKVCFQNRCLQLEFNAMHARAYLMSQNVDNMHAHFTDARTHTHAHTHTQNNNRVIEQSLHPEPKDEEYTNDDPGQCTRGIVQVGDDVFLAVITTQLNWVVRELD